MVAKYIQVKEAIKAWILEGRITPGEKIGSESDLMGQFNVSRHTIRQAIGELVHEDWLYTVQGGGTYCKDRRKSDTHGTMKTKTIGVMTTYISDYIFPYIIRGIESYTTENDYSLLLTSTNNNVDLEKKGLQNVMTNNIDGLIVEPTKSTYHNPNLNYYLNLERNKIPYVMINASYSELAGPSITLNDEKGGFIATEHLIKLGYTKVLGLFKTDDLQGIDRMKGYIDAHRKHHLLPFPDMVISFSTEEKGEKLQEQVRAMLTRKKENRPEAIVCYNDETALSILHVIRKLNMKVPEDLSIVGFDDSHLTEASEVQLTSVKHPKTELGRAAAEVLINLIENKNPDAGGSIVFEPELVIRNSTKPASS
ncbi:GntR family transcriptional regulator of arabinose operon [Pullulanibacillus pueri]|uniref:Arabinose metabolism transcriptional repressor n=1 Tax=Pullulanibacillus pueri TaxID=1437324 RepID=A0A8J2ZXX4_9BACL|nr:GntR family transcriptional regulator [Pullulanibacillus pueri]MBM7683004.1 GntR family transcriptional regulator of arabinose operon [Pullulanibacillus pueri]GGH85895.1 arabinose metabolism transcriptional repressor [Pullulanibacillus pueri]